MASPKLWLLPLPPILPLLPLSPLLVFSHSPLSFPSPVTQLSAKDVSLLEERIKRSGKRLAPPPSVTPPATAKPPEQDKKQAQE
jgi:hypothetical protein